MLKINQLVDYIKAQKPSKLVLTALFVSILILIFLLLSANLDHLKSSLLKIRVVDISLILFIFILMIFLVSTRLFLSLKLSCGKDYIHSLDSSILHILLLCILPARLGDVCYPFIIKRNLGLNMVSSISNLIILRFYDLSTVIVLLAFSSWILWQYSSVSSIEIIFQLTITYLAFIIFLIMLLKISPRILPKTSKSPLIGKGLEFLSTLRDNFFQFSIKDHIIIGSLTLARWICSAFLFLTIFNTVGISLEMFQVIFITVGLNLTVLIPIQTIGGFGITEAAMAYFLSLFNYPQEVAIASAISSRIVWLTAPLILGIIWYILRQTWLNKKSIS